jgi:hypothetical protein
VRRERGVAPDQLRGEAISQDIGLKRPSSQNGSQHCEVVRLWRASASYLWGPAAEGREITTRDDESEGRPMDGMEMD